MRDEFVYGMELIDFYGVFYNLRLVTRYTGVWDKLGLIFNIPKSFAHSEVQKTSDYPQVIRLFEQNKNAGGNNAIL